MNILCCFFMLMCGQSSGRADDQLDTLQIAVELYGDGEFEDAAALLGNVSRDELSESGRVLFDQYQPLIRHAAAGVTAARRDLGDAHRALGLLEFDGARAKIAAVVTSEFAPPDLKQDARALLATVQFRQRQRDLAADVADPGEDRAERYHQARIRLAQASESMTEKDWQMAQDHYSLASWYWPDAPLETVYVDPRDGAVFTQLPAARLHTVEVLVPVRNVTMNLQLGVGRLVAINSFQFSGAPVSGVGASGFVQLPVVQRIQLKTTVTAPAVEYRPQIERIDVTDKYVVIVRPTF
jgi:hypothetical protein